jgi:hypothetical protein
LSLRVRSSIHPFAPCRSARPRFHSLRRLCLPPCELAPARAFREKTNSRFSETYAVLPLPLAGPRQLTRRHRRGAILPKHRSRRRAVPQYWNRIRSRMPRNARMATRCPLRPVPPPPPSSLAVAARWAMSRVCGLMRGRSCPGPIDSAGPPPRAGCRSSASGASGSTHEFRWMVARDRRPHPGRRLTRNSDPWPGRPSSGSIDPGGSINQKEWRRARESRHGRGR